MANRAMMKSARIFPNDKVGPTQENKLTSDLAYDQHCHLSKSLLLFPATPKPLGNFNSRTV